MKLHKRVIKMDTSYFNLKACHALIVLALGLVSSSVHAFPARGTEVDTTCFAYNGTKPYSTGNTTTPRTHNSCALCHNTLNISISLSPEWPWTAAGGAANLPLGQKNFCFVQGIIATPSADMTVSQGGTVNLSARGFSPKGGPTKFPLTYTWTFSDNRTPLVGAKQDNVPFNAAGDIAITLTAVDPANTLTDPDPDTRIIHVSNAPTVANGDTYSVSAGSTLSKIAPGVLANDTGTPTLKAVLGTNVSHGSLSLTNNGSFTYTPVPNFAGVDTFTYTATNGILSSTPATVTLNVNSVPPTANADSYSLQSGIALPVTAPGVLANDTGPGTLTAVLGANVTKGSLALSADGSFSYTPNAGFTGTDSFTYKAHNSSGDGNLATVTLNVGSCTDKDKDGYSPEGGSCGPMDCNDKQSTVNPGLKEICTNKIDDDCNGLADNNDPACPLYAGIATDCIGKKLANMVRIDSATWSGGNLAVIGSKATIGATVTISNGTTTLGTTVVDYKGAWVYSLPVASSANAPCKVIATINNATGSKQVTGTTANCSSNNGAPASCN